LPEQDAPVLYDAGAGQTVPLLLTKSGKEFRVSHTLNPLTDERYFSFLTDTLDSIQKAKKLTTDFYGAKYRLWSDLVISRQGYKERRDWKEVTHQSDCIAVINALLHIQILDDTDANTATDDVLFDDESLSVIAFNAMQSGVLISNMTHSFREESKAEMDEYLAIKSNDPVPNTIASAVKLSDEEKLCRLGRKILREWTGYADGSEIPAWHLAATTDTFFARQIGRMGKSFAA